MIRTRSVAKRQKVEKCKPYMESVLFNSDSLFKIASYLPADGLLKLALACRRFGIAQSRSDVGGGDSLSLVEQTARRIVHDIATEEQKNALPGYEGENWLSKYDYLQSLRAPLTFDQLAMTLEYVEGNKSCVANRRSGWATAFCNNIMMAGKHYVSFETNQGTGFSIGVMRPGEAMQSAKGRPMFPLFYQNFTQRAESLQYNNSVNCCMYCAYNGKCWSSAWERISDSLPWDGMERLSPPYKIGMLLDFNEGTLSVYKN